MNSFSTSIDYNGLTVTSFEGNIYINSDESEIIDWLSQFNYPKSILVNESTYPLVLYREGALDLVLVNNFTKAGDKGIVVTVWLDFVGKQNDLSYLGRPPQEGQEDQYNIIWQSINRKIQEAVKTHQLPPIIFAFSDGTSRKPHFRYE